MVTPAGSMEGFRGPLGAAEGKRAMPGYLESPAAVTGDKSKRSVGPNEGSDDKA